MEITEKINSFLEIGSSNISKLAIFIFIIAGNYANDTFSCTLRKLIKDNMLIKHTLGIFIVLFFIGISQDEMKILSKLGLSIFLYIWYIFIMRSPLSIILIVVGIIIIMYILQEHLNDLNAQLNDKTNMKEVDTKNTQENIAYYSFLRNILFVTSVILSTFGFVSFLWISKQNFKEKFSIYKFLIGINDSECFKPKNK
tara:strand:- start:499 stop:1092 length:594 start_codon:yes stop_codon:yes gene_type:complete